LCYGNEVEDSLQIYLEIYFMIKINTLVDILEYSKELQNSQ